jgi:hypothetical protein
LRHLSFVGSVVQRDVDAALSRGRHPRPSIVEGRAADPMLATYVRGLRPGLMLPQDSDDLLLREPAWLHNHF